MAIREITLLVDDDDWRDIWAELQIRDGRCLPETEFGANEAGRCVAEIVRDLWEYRALGQGKRVTDGWPKRSV